MPLGTYESGKVVSPKHRRLYPPPGNTSGTHFCKRLIRPRGHSTAGRIFCFLWFFDPIPGQAPPPFRVFAITLIGRTTFGRTPLGEWSGRRRDLDLATHNNHYRQTSMSPARFEPTIAASERPQTHSLDRAVMARRVKSTKKPNYLIGNRTRDLLPCSVSTNCATACSKQY
jgi:hypothetical protein